MNEWIGDFEFDYELNETLDRIREQLDYEAREELDQLGDLDRDDHYDHDCGSQITADSCGAFCPVCGECVE